MDAARAPVLPPGQGFILRHPPRDEPDTLGRRRAIEVEPAPDVVAVGQKHLEPEIEVAPLLADEPRFASQPSGQIPRHRLGLVDRKERIRDRPGEPAAGLLVHESIAAERFDRQTDVGNLLVCLEEDSAQVSRELRRAAERSAQAPARTVDSAAETPLILGHGLATGRRHLPPRTDRGGLRPDDEPTLRLDQARPTWGGRVAPSFVRLELVELEGRALGQWSAQVEIEPAQLSSDFAELELRAAPAETGVARGVAQ